MRIISGSAKGRALKAPKNYDIRPTSDMVKEAVFSAVQFDIGEAAAIDLFSGTGQLGIEALSRGAKSCAFIDSSKNSLKITESNIAAAGFEKSAEIIYSDALTYLKKCKKSFDMAFVDPPYNMGIIEKILPELIKRMNPGGIIICEHEKGLVIDYPKENIKKRAYGNIEITMIFL